MSEDREEGQVTAPSTQEQSEEPAPKMHAPREVQKPPTVVPTEFATVFADKAMVAVDHASQTVTMTLLSFHPMPAHGSEGWTLGDQRWTVVAEVKMPALAMSELAIYYIGEMTGGLNIIPYIKKFAKENPNSVRRDRIGYGLGKLEQ
jgi:hypothetical protein